MISSQLLLNGAASVRSESSGQRRSRASRLTALGGTLVMLISFATAHGQTMPVTAVGATPGQFGVSATGQATYTIPIWVPPGVGDIEPNLSLAYNSSQAGSGLVGIGWSLAGLSQISRCRKTHAQDSWTAGVYLTMDDHFCVDGNKLWLAPWGSPEAGQGEAGSAYQTEIADFSLYTAKGSAGNGPAWFEVKGKNGLIYEYGNSQDSRAVLPGTSTPYAWALSKVRDRQGNNMVVTYAQSGGTLVPATVQYTQTVGSSTYPYAIVLVYGARDPDDRASGYLAGAPFSIDSKLLSIDVRYGGTSGTLVRKYRLSYADSPTTGRARLVSLQECAGSSGSECKAATTIGYQNGQVGLQPQSVTVSVGGELSSWRLYHRFADLNGDGRTDHIYAVSQGTNTKNWKVQFGTTSGLGSPVDTGIVTTDDDSIVIGDFRGLGTPSVLASSAGYAGTWYHYYWNGSGFAQEATGTPRGARLTNCYPCFTAADVNADGRADLVWAGSAVPHTPPFGIWVRENQAGTPLRFTGGTTGYQAYPLVPNMVGLFGNYDQPNGEIQRMDFNADGRDDVFITIRGGTSYDPVGTAQALLSQPEGPFANGPVISNINLPIPNPHTRIPSLANWNNDACTDLQYDTRVYVSACNGATGQLIETIPAGALIDWDADGRTDVLGWPSIQLSQGTSAAPPIPAGVAAAGSTVDFNGDGLSDVVWQLAPDSIGYKLHNGSFTPPDLVSSIVDGYGNHFTPTFKSITQSNYADTGAGIDSNRARYAGPFYLVDQLTASDGKGGTYQNQFFYWDARTNLQGRGLLGFAKKRTFDSRSGLYHYQEFLQLFPYMGAVNAERIVQPNDSTVIRRIINEHSYSQQQLGWDYWTSTFAFIETSTVEHFEVGGPYNGQLIVSSQTRNEFDEWGTLIGQTISAPTGTNPTYTASIVVPAVVNGTANWCLSKPTQIQQTNSHTLPGGAGITRTTDFAWDFINCRLLGSTQWGVATEYGYDNFGHVNAITVTPAAGQGQAARTTSIDWGTDGRFPRTVTNPKGHITRLQWDTEAGICTAGTSNLAALRCVTDPNGLTTRLDVDAFGRLLREQRPDGTATDYVLSACNAANGYCGVSDLRYSVQSTLRDTANAVIRTDTQHFDGLDRPRYVYQQTLSGAMSGVITNYDALGRLSSQSTPFLSGDPVWYTTVHYDLLGRPTRIERQTSESDTSISSTLISYEGLRTVTADPLNRSSTVVRNIIGQIMQTIDAAGSDTDYEYDAFGNLLKTRDAYGNEIVLTYNARGMKLSSVDPDMGYWRYHYYPLGELKSQTDARGQTVTFTYDALSRPLTRVEPEGTTTWTWDTATRGIGQLTSISSPGGYGENYTYDNLGRVHSDTTVIDGATYSYTYGYHASQGTLQTLEYPASIGTPFKVTYDYQYTHLVRVKDYQTPSTVFWQANATNARHQIIDVQLGNGLLTNTTYDRISGLMDRIDSGFGADSAQQQLVYTWNKVGSLIQREDLNQGTLNEAFEYDVLDRLDIVRRSGVVNLDMAYDAIGNITSKSDVGAYTYHATKRHAVVSAGSNSYGYDANGNMTTRNGLATTWYSYNLPNQINSTSGKYARFWYGADRQRYKQQHHAWVGGGSLRTTIYAGGLFEKFTDDGAGPVYRHYIVADGTIIANHLKTDGASWTAWQTKDHLGSADSEYYTTPDHETPPQTPQSRYANDAFGKRRDWDWNGAPGSDDIDVAWSNFSNRGFTGHEHLDNVGGLIHMNGRVYDPAIGRFMSADPFVQAPYFSQSLNRYSYAFNNPLSYTDPSGFFVFVIRFGGGGGGSDFGGATGGGSYGFRLSVTVGENRQRSVVYGSSGTERLAPALGGRVTIADRNGARCYPVVCSQMDWSADTSPQPPPTQATVVRPTTPQLQPAVDRSVPGIGSSTGGGTVLAGAALPIAGRTAARNPYVLGGAVVIGGSLYAVLNYSQTAGSLSRPDYMSGPEYVPPTSPNADGVSPGDPNQHDPGRDQSAQALQINNSQLGRKFGEHMDSNLPGYRTHLEYRALAQDIYGNPAARVTRYASGPYAGETHYQVGSNLLRIGPDRTFRSLYPL